MRFFDSVLFFVAGAIVGVFGYHYYFKDASTKRDPMPDNKQQILLKQIRKVAKLITIEGEFSNIHEYNDKGWGGVGAFSKKAIIQVDAKVAVGYDLQKATFEADDATKTIYVKNLPDPEILSIDHDIQYYDISEGIFGSFSEEEFTSISAIAKKKLAKEAKTGELMEKAKVEGLEALEIIRLIVELSGWKLVIEGQNPMNDSTLNKTPDTMNIPPVTQDSFQD